MANSLYLEKDGISLQLNGSIDRYPSLAHLIIKDDICLKTLPKIYSEYGYDFVKEAVCKYYLRNKVELKLDEPDGDIILGIEVKAKIQTANSDEALRVPKDALWEDEEGNFVFVVKDGKAVKTEVETGARNDSMVEICAGIAEGDVVVWNETSEITDGMSVKLD